MNRHNREPTFWTCPITKIIKAKLPVDLLCLVLLIGLSSTSSVIAQSGSRSAAPAAASAFSTAVTTFTQPSISGDNANLSTQGFSQFTNQEFNPEQYLTPPNSTAGRLSSSSLGIPAAAVVDSIFEINDPSSIVVIDHSAWDRFLACYLITDSQGLNRVRYGDVSNTSQQQLENYLCYLESVDLRTLSREEQLAYWFNLYNAKIVDVVLTHYPIRSIRQIKQKFTDFVGPFDDPGAVTVLGKALSLSEIESGIVRPIFRDPRIHFALNCGSYGCPNLASTAWTAENLDARLDEAAINYVNSGRAVKSGLFGVRVSKIFKWYKDDFGGSDQAVIAYLQQYADSTTCKQLERARGRIAGHFYDWSLNDAKITRPRLLEPFIR